MKELEKELEVLQFRCLHFEAKCEELEIMLANSEKELKKYIKTGAKNESK